MLGIQDLLKIIVEISDEEKKFISTQAFLLRRYHAHENA